MDIVSRVKELNLPVGSYVVFGSGPLQIHGIRESKDIDICVTQEIYDRCKKENGWEEVVRPNGQKVLLKDVFDIGVNWSYGNYKTTCEQLFKTAEIIDGVAFASLQEFLKWKYEMSREKDLIDIKLVEEYLSKHPKN